MLNKVGKLTFIVCVCSLFLWQNLSFGGYPDQWHTENNELDIKYDNLDRAEEKLETYRDALSDLIGKWSANKKKISSDTEVTLASAFATTASALGSALSKSTPAAAVAGGLLTLKKAVDAGMGISASDSYVSAMSTADSAVESAVTDIATAYSEYKSQYTRYFDVCAGHQLCRYNGNVATPVYSRDKLYKAVNEDNQTRGWYHPNRISPSAPEHSIDPFYDEDDWDMGDLPHEHECEGTCTVTFRSPYKALTAHRQKCGEGYTVAGTGVGCGKTSYTCDKNHSRWADWHKIRECGLTYLGGDDGVSEVDCSYQYRNCTSVSSTHAIPDYFGNLANTLTNCRETTSSDDTQAPSTPDNGDADGSDTDQAQNPSTPVDNSPNCDLCTGSCSACTQPSTPTYHECGFHLTSESGDHSFQASCGRTNAWGHLCMFTNYYTCFNHTCMFPTFQCGRASCTEAVADPNEHRRTCINGHTYWSCNTGPPDMVEHHRTRTCTRRKALRQEQDPLTGLNTVVYGECGESWDMCDTRCRDVFGRVGTHQE